MLNIIKTQKLFFLAVLMLLPLSTQAKFSKYIGVGTTRATLRSEDGKSGWGEYVGLGLEYSRPSSLLLAIEAAYATKKVTLENKSWPNSWEPPFSIGSVGDILVDGAYFDLAILLGYNFPKMCLNTSTKIFTGPVLSDQIKQLGKIHLNNEIVLEPDEIANYKFDYKRAETEGVTNFSIGAMIGLTISYKSVGIEARYVRSFTKRNYRMGLAINDELDCFYAIFRYAF